MKEDIRLSDIVRSTQGRDRGKLYMVVNCDEDFLFLSDGKYRKLGGPKKKRRKHVRLECECTATAGEKLRRGIRVTDSELRSTLSDYMAESQEEF